MNYKQENGRFFRIEELYAFVACEEGGEGIMGYTTPHGMLLPLIGADMERVESIKPIADKIAALKGIKYEIRKFKVVTD